MPKSKPKHTHTWTVWWESGTVVGRQCAPCGARERMDTAWCNESHAAENEALLKHLQDQAKDETP